MVLLDPRTDLANQAIQDARRDAKIMTDLIGFYNSMPVIAPITTAEQAKEFLQKPMEYFEAAILRDCGVTFATGAKPKASTIAQMFEIPHSTMFDRLTQTRLKSVKLPLYTFDEATAKIELMPESEALIREEWALYVEEGAETEEMGKVQKLADTINEMSGLYGLDGTDLHRVVGALRFLRTVAKPGGGWMLAPAFDEIKKRIGQSKSQV